MQRAPRTKIIIFNNYEKRQSIHLLWPWRNSVSVFRNLDGPVRSGWSCPEIVFRCFGNWMVLFEVDGPVPKRCFGVSETGWSCSKWMVLSQKGVSVFRKMLWYFQNSVSKQCFGMDAPVPEAGWSCVGVSGGVSERCFGMDGLVSVFRNGVSEWMHLSRNGWTCVGVSGGVSERCFGMDALVSVFRNGVSEWMHLSRRIMLSSTTAAGINLRNSVDH